MEPHQYNYQPDKKFAKGIYFNRTQNAPNFVVGSLGINVDEAFAWIQQQQRSATGFVNIDIKQSKGGKFYLELNEYKSKQSAQQPPQQPSSPKHLSLIHI